MDFNANTYLTVTVTPGSFVANNPALLVVHPSMSHLGKVGQLMDVEIVSVPKDVWDGLKGDVVQSLNTLDGVRRVDVQETPKARAKRGGDEL